MNFEKNIAQEEIEGKKYEDMVKEAQIYRKVLKWGRLYAWLHICHHQCIHVLG